MGAYTKIHGVNDAHILSGIPGCLRFFSLLRLPFLKGDINTFPSLMDVSSSRTPRSGGSSLAKRDSGYARGSQ